MYPHGENKPILTYIIMWLYTNDDAFPEDSDIISELFDKRSDFTILSCKTSWYGYEFEVSYSSENFSAYPTYSRCYIEIDDVNYGNDIFVNFRIETQDKKGDFHFEKNTYVWSGVIPLSWNFLCTCRRRPLGESGSLGCDD